MSEYDLVKDLEYWRPERPDEWKMDEFIRETKSLIEELSQTQKELQGYKETVRQIRKANENLDIDEVDRDSLICDIFIEFDLSRNLNKGDSNA